MKFMLLHVLLILIAFCHRGYSEHSKDFFKPKKSLAPSSKRPEPTQIDFGKKSDIGGCPRQTLAELEDFQAKLTLKKKPTSEDLAYITKLNSHLSAVPGGTGPGGVAGDWCSEDPKSDFDPPQKDDLKKCWDGTADEQVKKIQKCLKGIVAETKARSQERLLWPAVETMKGCGCTVEGKDTETGLKGRTLFSCITDDGQGFLVSPIAFKPGLGIMGIPSDKFKGCMFDFVYKKDWPEPQPYLGSGSDNCFACHRRSDPENYRSGTPCPGVSEKVKLASETKEESPVKKSKSFKDGLFSPFSP